MHAINARHFALIALATGLAACSPKSQSGSAIPTNDVEQRGVIGGSPMAKDATIAKSTVMIRNDRFKTLCTGSIISSRVIVTAAHCVQVPASEIKVVFGTNFYQTGNPEVAVESVRTIEGYEDWKNELSNRHDVAILRIKGKLPPGYQPIPVLKKTTAIKPGMKAIVAGFGVSDTSTGSKGELRYGFVNITNPSWGLGNDFVADHSNGVGACHGDSGGPLIIRVGDRPVLAGIISSDIHYGADDCTGNAIFIKVDAYESWLAEAAGL